ncbi:MAG: hypothetical protein IT178_13895, partial [Acidobacteria bacterium]|nr:hypothetical protein [Acidobacteriota bacterium]
MHRALLLLLLMACASPAAAATDRQVRTFAWSASRALAIEVGGGRIRVEGSTRTDIELVISRTAPTTDALALLPIDVEETPERVGVRVRQVDGGTDAAITADVVVRVPMTARVEMLRLDEGPITIERFQGWLTAEAKRGALQATDVTGTLRLETGIGNLTLTNARLDPKGLLRLRAFNGDVTLDMPAAPPNARVMALALNGRITS